MNSRTSPLLGAIQATHSSIGLSVDSALNHGAYFQLAGILVVYFLTLIEAVQRKERNPTAGLILIGSGITIVSILPWGFALAYGMTIDGFVGYSLFSMIGPIVLQFYFIQRFYAKYIEKQPMGWTMTVVSTLSIAVVIGASIHLIVTPWPLKQPNFFSYGLLILWFIGAFMFVYYLSISFYDQFTQENPLEESEFYKNDPTLHNPQWTMISLFSTIVFLISLFIGEIIGVCFFGMISSNPDRFAISVVVFCLYLVSIVNLLLWTTLKTIYLGVEQIESNEVVLLIDTKKDDSSKTVVSV